MPAPTGRSFENEAIWILTPADGRIPEIRAVSDRLGLFHQLCWDWPQTDWGRPADAPTAPPSRAASRCVRIRKAAPVRMRRAAPVWAAHDHPAPMY
ncbi:hypothetical protein [Streptomyces spiralis]